PERAPVRRQRGLEQRLQRCNFRLDLVLGPRRQAELRAGGHLAMTQLGVAVREAELRGIDPARALAVDDEHALENRGPVAAVGARVHPDAAADGPGDGAGELEPAEPGRARAVQADRIRGAATCDEALAVDLGLRDLARQLERKAVEALIREEEVRAESDRCDRQLALRRPGRRL